MLRMFACLSLTIGAAFADITPDQRLEDIALARRALEEIHPGYVRYTDRATLDALWDGLAAKAGEGLSDARFYAELSGVLAAIKCDHTKAEPSKRWNQGRDERSVHFPFRVKVVDGVGHIAATGVGGLFIGDRIIDIDGVAWADIQERITALIARDGDTPHAALATFEGMSDFGVSGFEHYYPFLFGDRSQAIIRVAGRHGGPREVLVDKIDRAAWRALEVGPPRARNFDDAVTYENLGDGVALLRVDTFVNYRRPVEPAEIYDPVFRQMAEDGVETLILDTRRNGGGSTDAMLNLATRFIDEPTAFMRWKRVRTEDVTGYQPALSTWERLALKPPAEAYRALDGDWAGWYELGDVADPLALRTTPPAEPGFDGEVIALTSGQNASGITMLLAFLKQHGDVTLIGEPTGGSAEGPTAGVIYFLTLPQSGVVVRIPWQLQRLNVDDPETGGGVTPDDIVRPGLNDLLTGRDAALETAIARAKGGARAGR